MDFKSLLPATILVLFATEKSSAQSGEFSDLCQSPTDCPNNYIRIGTRCIKFSTTQRSFASAQSDCLSDGGKLFEPESKIDQDLILFHPSATSNIYLGILVDGTGARYASNSMPVPYTDYFSSVTFTRDCIYVLIPSTKIFNHKTWGDVNCMSVRSYICEFGPITCENVNTLFVGAIHSKRTADDCRQHCIWSQTCQFFFSRPSDNACGLVEFATTDRAMLPDITSGLVGNDATDGLLVGAKMSAVDVDDCNQFCCSDASCVSSIFDGVRGECSLNYDNLVKKIPVPEQFQISSTLRTC